MAKQIIRLFWIIVLASKAYVTCFVVVDSQWIPGLDDDPNPNVELPMQYQ